MNTIEQAGSRGRRRPLAGRGVKNSMRWLCVLAFAAMLAAGQARSADAHVNSTKGISRSSQMSACIAMGGTYIDVTENTSICKYPDGSFCVMNYPNDISVCVWVEPSGSQSGQTGGASHSWRVPVRVIDAAPIVADREQPATAPVDDAAPVIENTTDETTPVIENGGTIDDTAADAGEVTEPIVEEPAEPVTDEPVTDPVVDPLPPADDAIVDETIVDHEFVTEPALEEPTVGGGDDGTILIYDAPVDSGIELTADTPEE